MTQKALPADVYDVRETDRLAVWRADPRRVIVVGQKYRANPATSYCFAGGCADCYPGSNARCWRRRTQMTFVYRVREQLYTDHEHGLGRFYSVSLVRPDVWQLRAFGVLPRDLDRPRHQWHTLTGIVTEAEIGERVE